MCATRMAKRLLFERLKYNYDVRRLHTLIRGSKSFTVNKTIIDRLLDPSTIVSYYALSYA
jgi:hypothetical protein